MSAPAPPPPPAAPTRPRRPSAWRQLATLFGRDVAQELASRDMLTSMGVYALLVMVVFGAALASSAEAGGVRQLSAGLLWVTVTFTSLLGLNRSFAAEREEAGLDGLLLAPLDRSLLFLAKAASNLAFLLMVEAVACPLFLLLFWGGVPLAPGAAWALAPLLLGSLGIAGLGTFLASMASASRGKDVLLAVLFVPLAYPLLHAVVAATGAAILGGDIAGAFVPAVALAFGYDVVMVSVSWLLYDFVISA